MMVLLYLYKGNTMSHVLTVKIPHPLLDRLEEVAHQKGRSKGALVREAIESHLGKTAAAHPGTDEIAHATEAILKGKRSRLKVDWKEIHRMARGVPLSLSPEEEVRRARRRGL
jgi:predicted DNA-binding protein